MAIDVAFPACPCPKKQYEEPQFGLWRSLVARPSGGRKVAGSSPASPTILKIARTYVVAGVLL